MSIRRFRRKVRCVLKHGPHGCPHIERHTRRSKESIAAAHAHTLAPPLVDQTGRHTRN